MKIKRLIGGNLESNGYVIYDMEGGEAYIIDPGYQPDRFLELLQKLSVKLKGILLTHHHYDHVGGVDKIRNETGCPVMIHREDADMYQKYVDVMLEDGDKLMLGDEELNILLTPGHTRGGICIFSEQSKLAFTGDTIFNVDLGRTDLTDGSEQQMRTSILSTIANWGNDVTIYPGHGDSATMKYVRNHNQEYLDIVQA